MAQANNSKVSGPAQGSKYRFIYGYGFIPSTSGGIMTKQTNVGLDVGNRRAKVTIQAIDENGNLVFNADGSPKLLNASIPALYAFDEPVVLGKSGNKSGQEINAQYFSLFFIVDKEKNKGIYLRFGRDTLASQSVIQKLDEQKYTPLHIQRLTQAVLYQWSLQHKCDLAKLGKLNICVSMPPGSYQKPAIYKRAKKAYSDAFNTGQSHMQIRPEKGKTAQIVTRLHSIVREAVVWGADIPRRNELILVVDLGGGTDDIALFNGSSEPIDSQTIKAGLISMYKKINPANPWKVELRILSDKSYMPNELLSYFNQRELMIQMINRDNSKPADRIYLIGGGASLIKRFKPAKNTFNQLADKVVIKDQYATSQANWKEASK